jgi:hypothetical protein
MLRRDEQSTRHMDVIDTYVAIAITARTNVHAEFLLIFLTESIENAIVDDDKLLQ